jgi:hypothetical protein
MRFRLYKHGPSKTGGYIGWLETCKGKVVAFVKRDGRLQFNW